jgi:hypothetical protein
VHHELPQFVVVHLQPQQRVLQRRCVEDVHRGGVGEEGGVIIIVIFVSLLLAIVLFRLIII